MANNSSDSKQPTGLQRYRQEQQAAKADTAKPDTAKADTAKPDTVVASQPARDGEQYLPAWKRTPVTFIEERIKQFGAERLQLSPLYLPPDIEIAFARNPKQDDEASIYHYMDLGYRPVQIEDVTSDPVEAKEMGKIAIRGTRSGPNNTVLVGSSLCLMWINKAVKRKRDEASWAESKANLAEGGKRFMVERGMPEELVESGLQKRERARVDLSSGFDRSLDAAIDDSDKDYLH